MQFTNSPLYLIICELIVPSFHDIICAINVPSDNIQTQSSFV